MTTEELLARIEAVLAEEREAIVALDAERVEGLVADKEGLFSGLAAARLDEQHGLALARVLSAAKQNCLLLAHARDLAKQTAAAIAREVNGATSESGAAPGPGASAFGATARRGVRLSITG